MTILTRNIGILKQEVQNHVAANAVIQGQYWDKKSGRGCFIGCLTRNNDPGPLVDLYGLPLHLTRIAEAIFERLPKEEAKEFFASFPDAVAVDGKDLSLVHWKFLAETLQALPEQPAEIRAVINPVISGIAGLASGGEWSFAEAAARAAARAAGEAAWAAGEAAGEADEAAAMAARDAARAAVWAARAAGEANGEADEAAAMVARDTARAAAGAARAAGEAAEAAIAARAAVWAAGAAGEADEAAFWAAGEAARAAVWAATEAAAETRRQRDSLLQLIREAPVPTAS